MVSRDIVRCCISMFAWGLIASTLRPWHGHLKQTLHNMVGLLFYLKSMFFISLYPLI